MGDDLSNVIAFPKIQEGADAVPPPAEVVRPALGACKHRRTNLVMESRRMICRDCEAEVDLFNWLYDYVGRWSRENAAYKQATAQRKDAEARLAEVLRAEKNAKSRARKAGVTLTSAQARLLLQVINAQDSILQRALGRDQVVAEYELLGIDKKVASSALVEVRAQLNLKAPVVEAAS